MLHIPGKLTLPLLHCVPSPKTVHLTLTHQQQKSNPSYLHFAKEEISGNDIIPFQHLHNESIHVNPRFLLYFIISKGRDQYQ